MYKIIMSKSADYDLEQILNYLTNKLCTLVAATNFANKMEKCLYLLSE